jgi:hypothetical protein
VLPQPSVASPHWRFCDAHVAGVHPDAHGPPVPHWSGLPPPPHDMPTGHGPQLMVLPQPSAMVPQPAFAATHVRGTQRVSHA